MGRYLMMVQSRARDGRDEEFNHWYDDIHLDEIRAVPGVVSARRYDALPTSPGRPDLPYLALYEIEADDPHAVLAEMNVRRRDGRIVRADALDRSTAKVWLYRAR